MLHMHVPHAALLRCAAQLRRHLALFALAAVLGALAFWVMGRVAGAGIVILRPDGAELFSSAL